MKKFITYLLISFVSTLISLYTFESYLTYNSNQPKININKKIIKKNYETRSKSEIFKDLLTKDKDISVTITPSKFNSLDKDIHFLSGVSKSKTIDCNENGYFSIYESDRYGFNNPDTQWDSKEFGFILLGDSFTHGACVNRPNDVASSLRELSKSNVLNLGYKANGPLSMLATQKEYAPKNTRNIIWLYFEGNDLTDLNFELKNKILNNYYLDKNYTQNLKSKQKFINGQIKKIISQSIILEDSIVDQAIRNSRPKNKVLKFIRMNETKKVFSAILNREKRDKLPYDEFKNILIRAKTLALENNSVFHFVYLPQFERYNKKVSNKDYEIIKTIVEKLEINFIDLHKGVFLNENDPLELFPFKMWGHYNKKGYKKIAKYIYMKIK